MTANGKPRVCVFKADGTNCEVETAHAVTLAGGQPEILPMNRLRDRSVQLEDYDAMVLPGGFSYGDDVVSGKIMAVELMSFLADALGEFVAAGKPIMGICNGFQVLVRTGLLPFGEIGKTQATLSQNASGHFECRWVSMRKEGNAEIVEGLPERIDLPVANGEGKFYADAATLSRIETAGLVALRYVDDAGEQTQAYPANPNGSLSAIAGVCDPSGRILGLMPHPERYIARHQHPDWRDMPKDAEPQGLAFFQGLMALA
jgi:phosphoribosylformylglycinamidine synthase